MVPQIGEAQAAGKRGGLSQKTAYACKVVLPPSLIQGVSIKNSWLLLAACEYVERNNNVCITQARCLDTSDEQASLMLKNTYMSLQRLRVPGMHTGSECP